MRELTLHEKITIKGMLARFGLKLPHMTMWHALHWVHHCFGKSPNQLPQLRNARPVRRSFYHKAKRTTVLLKAS